MATELYLNPDNTVGGLDSGQVMVAPTQEEFEECCCACPAETPCDQCECTPDSIELYFEGVLDCDNPGTPFAWNGAWICLSQDPTCACQWTAVSGGVTFIIGVDAGGWFITAQRTVGGKLHIYFSRSSVAVVDDCDEERSGVANELGVGDCNTTFGPVIVYKGYDGTVSWRPCCL